MAETTRRRNRLLGALSALWHGLDWTRRLVFNLAFLALVIFLISLLLAGSGLEIEDGTALVLAPSGELVEQLYGDPGERLLLELLGQPQRIEALMRDLLDAVERAKDDDRIELLVLDVEMLAGGGLSKLERLRAAIEEFRAAGKRVIAVGDFYLQSQYYVASAADEIVLHPMGAVLLTGYGFSRNHYRELLDRLEIEWNVFRVGEYKSAVEPYLFDEMSPEAREAASEWLGDLWSAYTSGVAEARGLAPEEIDAYVDGYHLRLAEVSGDMAELARVSGLVDRVATRDEVRQELIDLVGATEDGESYRQIGYRSYLAAAGRPEREGAGTVAVVIASGTILDGNQPPGLIGGDSTARLIRQAREDDEVDAVVLRVDSPGGSAFASEVIRRQVELTREAGKPVVASMGSVAASGGYWISMSADEIWASPTTLTGSIGIYAMAPTFEGTLAKIGIRPDSVGTSAWAGRLTPEISLPEEVRETLRLMIERGYRDFVERAAAGRGMTFEEVDQVARGRVWSGEDALDLGLVDRLGDLEQAVRSAAARAEIDDDFKVRIFERRPSRRARLVERLLSRLPGSRAAGLNPTGSPAGWLLRLAGLEETARLAERPQGPFALWAHCFCDPRRQRPLDVSRALAALARTP